MHQAGEEASSCGAACTAHAAVHSAGLPGQGLVTLVTMMPQAQHTVAEGCPALSTVQVQQV